MDYFAIRFVDQDISSTAPGSRCGEICIGEFRERFSSDRVWTEEECQRQWLAAASLITIAAKAAFVTSVHAERAVRPRQGMSEEGEPISEWATTLHAIRAFAEEQRP